ncbi:MAG: 3-isopropylmalate dehydrogenase, partial [Candidatus Poribacteria bacterium]|nr:3-isopropylmalate dehydrogenase [Candidatus Poribacteria bacterium]
YEYGLLGGCAIDATGRSLPDETLDLCRRSDAILFGAAGGPKWDNVAPAERPERALARLRKEFDLYVNLRPIRGRKSLAPTLPLKDRLIGEGIDFLIIRELAGGLYYGEPRGVYQDADGLRGVNTMVYTEREVERVVRQAFELARNRRKKVTSVDKENMLEASRVWRQVTLRVHKEFPDVELDHLLIDACAYIMILDPSRFDVLVTGNIFGDILSDEAAVIVGSLGMLPSASWGDGKPALYEPVHGTAPDIAGKGLANPCAAILSAALMLRHSFGLEAEAKSIEAAVDAAIDAGLRTGDIKQDGMKTVGTAEMTNAILSNL